jgi:hypothetical protein
MIVECLLRFRRCDLFEQDAQREAEDEGKEGAGFAARVDCGAHVTEFLCRRQLLGKEFDECDSIANCPQPATTDRRAAISCGDGTRRRPWVSRRTPSVMVSGPGPSW